METIICKNDLFNCFCKEEKEHKGLHKCRCGGSWDDDKTPYSFPNVSMGFNAFPLLGFEKD